MYLFNKIIRKIYMLLLFINWYRKKSVEQTNLARGVFRNRQSIRVAIKYNYRTCVYFPCVLNLFLTTSCYSLYYGFFCSKTVNIHYIGDSEEEAVEPGGWLWFYYCTTKMLQHGYAISGGDWGLTLKPAWAYQRLEAGHFGARTCSEAWAK